MQGFSVKSGTAAGYLKTVAVPKSWAGQTDPAAVRRRPKRSQGLGQRASRRHPSGRLQRFRAGHFGPGAGRRDGHDRGRGPERIHGRRAGQRHAVCRLPVRRHHPQGRPDGRARSPHLPPSGPDDAGREPQGRPAASGHGAGQCGPQGRARCRGLSRAVRSGRTAGGPDGRPAHGLGPGTGRGGGQGLRGRGQHASPLGRGTPPPLHPGRDAERGGPGRRDRPTPLRVPRSRGGGHAGLRQRRADQGSRRQPPRDPSPARPQPDARAGAPGRRAFPGRQRQLLSGPPTTRPAKSSWRPATSSACSSSARPRWSGSATAPTKSGKPTPRTTPSTTPSWSGPWAR